MEGFLQPWKASVLVLFLGISLVFAQEEEEGPAKKWYLIHGWLMYAAFGVLMPLAIFVSRFGKPYFKFWLHVHRALNILAVVAIVISFSVAVNKDLAGGIQIDNIHVVLGIAIFCAVGLQVLLALIKPKVGSRPRVFWYAIHFTLGVGSVALGWVNIYSGFGYYKETWNSGITVLRNLFVIQIAIVAWLWLLLDRLDYKHRVRDSTLINANGVDNANAHNKRLNGGEAGEYSDTRGLSLPPNTYESNAV